MIRSIISCALLLGVANAARQIVVDPSPPPPGPSTADVPGLVFSVVVPGKSNADWSATDSSNFCSAMVNLTSGYNKDLVKCQVNAITSSVNYLAAAVGGQMYWGNAVGATDADKTAALNSRNLLESQISLNQTLALNGFYGSNANDTCDSSYVAGVVDAASTQLTTAGMPGPASCRIGPLGMTAETYDSTAKACTRAGFASVPVSSSSLCFTSTTANVGTSTVDTVGVDNGRTCPSGSNYVTAGTSVTVSGAAGDTITLAAGAGGVQTVTIGTAVLTGTATLSAGESGIAISGVTATEITGAVTGTGCTAASVAGLINGVHIVNTFTNTGAGEGITFTIPDSGCTAAAGATGTTSMLFNGAWSPSCDSSATFYNAYNSLSTSTTNGVNLLGRPCPACATVAAPTTASQWSYTGPNAGKFCAASSLTGGTAGVARDWYTPVSGAGMRGTSCVQIDVNNQGAGNALTGTPMIGAAIPYGTATTDIFRTTSQSPVGVFSSSSFVPYTAANAATVAIDTEWNTPCSTPKINKAGALLGVAGAGSCNTQSKFWNAGTGAAPTGNGVISDTETYGVLKSNFLAPIIGPTPAPAPVTPAPAPVTPVPAPSPTPPSPTPLVCTYRGTYEITPLYGPCNKYYIASGTKSNCAENFVHLRTKSNLGGKYDRVRWAIAATAQNGVGTPTRVVAEARSGVGACTNRNLAAPSNPIPGLKVGGSSWQWQFRPYPDSAECDHVNMISENRLDTTAFLSVPKPCKTFRYNESDGGRQRFKLIKV